VALEKSLSKPKKWVCCEIRAEKLFAIEPYKLTHAFLIPFPEMKNIKWRMYILSVWNLGPAYIQICSLPYRSKQYV